LCVVVVVLSFYLAFSFLLVERVNTYSTNLPQETDVVAVTPEESWPATGKVEFENVSYRYRPGLPYVLKDVSFTIKGGEKVGVCGRTGAGKTSILYALFRLVELDPSLSPVFLDVNTGLPMFDVKTDELPNHGRILIDGIDISKVSLQRLRRSIAIIPQDPTFVLFVVRMFLFLFFFFSSPDCLQVASVIIWIFETFILIRRYGMCWS
jgi:ABC-type multidrug transport system fused ATPase/permease subunit